MKTVTFTLLMMMCVYVTSLKAQELPELFSIHDSNTLELSTSADTKSQKLLQFPDIIGHTFVEDFDVLSFLQDDGKLKFDFKLFDSDLDLEFTPLEIKSDPNNFKWSGHNPLTNDEVCIISTDHGTHGFMTINNESYDFFQLDDNLIQVLKYSTIGDYTHSCSANHTSPNGASPPNPNPDCWPGDCSATINVHYLITPEVEDWFSDNNLSIQFLSILTQKVNFSFAVSEVSHRIQYSNSFFDWEFDETNDNITLNSEIELFIDSPEADLIRQENDADLVIMLVDYYFANDLSQGYAGGINPGYERSYAMVQIATASFLNTVTHEIGHLLGADHEKSFTSDVTRCNYGKEIVFFASSDEDFIGTSFHTLMDVNAPLKQPDDVNIRTSHFSNPNVRIFSYYSTGQHGFVNGVTSTFDGEVNNAGRINNLGCEIAAYEGDTNFAVHILGTYNPCNNNEVFEAQITQATEAISGIAPYSYSWSWNVAGISNSSLFPSYNIPSNSSTIQFDISNITMCQFIFLNVEVTSSDGIITQASKRIYIGCEDCEMPTRRNTLTSSQNKKSQPSLVHPNPAHTHIHIGNISSLNSTYSIYSLSGVVVQKGNIPESKQIDISSLNNGAYFIKIHSTSNPASLKFIKIQ